MRDFKAEPLLEQRRVLTGDMATPPGAQYGTFVIPIRSPVGNKTKVLAICMADDGGVTGWERVTVEMVMSRGKQTLAQTPRLNVLSTIRALFWHGHETVALLFHSDQSQEHIQFPHRVTLWKPRGEQWMTPPLDILG